MIFPCLRCSTALAWSCLFIKFLEDKKDDLFLANTPSVSNYLLLLIFFINLTARLIQKIYVNIQIHKLCLKYVGWWSELYFFLIRRAVKFVRKNQRRQVFWYEGVWFCGSIYLFFNYDKSLICRYLVLGTSSVPK